MKKKNILLFAVCIVCLLFCIGLLIDSDVNSTNGGINTSTKSKIGYSHVNNSFDMQCSSEFFHSGVMTPRKDVSVNNVSAKMPSMKLSKNVSLDVFSRQSERISQHSTVTLNNAPSYNMRTRSVNNQMDDNSRYLMSNTWMLAMNTFDESTTMQTRGGGLPGLNPEPNEGAIGSEYVLLLFALFYVIVKIRYMKIG